MKILLIISLIAFTVPVDAQWYKRKCQVTDINNCSPEEFDCLWETASKNVRTGVITLGIGTSLIVAGTIIVALSYDGGWGLSTGQMICGFMIMGSAISDLYFIPYSVVWANRKFSLKTNPCYDASNYGALNFSPTINRNPFNNSYQVGITATLSF